ncbi:hypothetical protein B0T26DRAFT_365769 [Lasiosphaeria miniovina]|uniref:NACHT domain-containing protein n=1 Tax=Lasiosphaeria miniovina TaxID=1954250 RepID=A0AA40DRH7_9PEZI|nr:uncharacterized protein B0T26DRAFT_365769 [Lasiosphaeria miniovina]KAK0713509.1 hypothetical protein B0T26DRAFT_365769 [Lasiosphaeria miniovina]
MPLKAPAPAQSAARRAIENAFKDLERTISPADSRDFSSTTLDDVRKAAIDVERQLAARQSLRNMRRLEPLFQGLEHYAKVIDVLCNGTDYMSWIWAPIKLIMKISSDYVEAFERIIKAYSQIAASLGRFRLLEQSFKGKPQLYPTFAIFYADILRFHKAAYKFVTRRCWKIIFVTAWGRFQREFENILEDLKNHEDLIDKEVNAHNIVEAREMRAHLEAWRIESSERLAREEKERTARQLQDLTSWLRLDNSDQIVLLDSITKVGTDYPGTVDWIVKKPQVVAWLRSTSEVPFLWLQGGPGTGKSVIIGRLLAFLKASNSSVVLSHACSYSYNSSTMYDQIIKSLLLQCTRVDGDLVAHIWEEYVGGKQPNLSLLEKLLETAIEIISGNKQGNNTVHIILDGLDECPNDKQRRLIRLMERLASVGNTCKVLVSSRDSTALQGRLKMKHILSLCEEKASLTEAIARFSELRLGIMGDKLMQLRITEETKMKLAKRIGDKSDGMFLWACLVLNYLSANFFYSGDEFVEAVDSLPPELSQFYEKILSRVLSDLDSRSAARLKTIFGWIAFSRRPLRKSELQSALLFHEDGPTGSHPVPAYVLEACKPLVEERRNSTLVFIHVSVKDFLLSDACKSSVRMDDFAVRWENGIASLRCLRAALGVFNPRSSKYNREIQLVRGVWGFVAYASEFWDLQLVEMVTIPVANWDARFGVVAADLSAALATPRPGHVDMPQGQVIEEIEPIRCYPSLWYDATMSLQDRSEGLARPQGVQTGDDMKEPTHIRHISENYETAVQHLINLEDHYEATGSELALFRENFAGHAYPCRFASCAHPATGFKTSEERNAHESSHAPKFPCTEPSCQYPPFTSSRALKKHISDCHDKQRVKLIVRKTILSGNRVIESHAEVKAIGLGEPGYRPNLSRRIVNTRGSVMETAKRKVGSISLLQQFLAAQDVMLRANGNNSANTVELAGDGGLAVSESKSGSLVTSNDVGDHHDTRDHDTRDQSWADMFLAGPVQVKYNSAAELDHLLEELNRNF